jgi:hypothetical protein
MPISTYDGKKLPAYPTNLANHDTFFIPLAVGLSLSLCPAGKR